LRLLIFLAMFRDQGDDGHVIAGVLLLNGWCICWHFCDLFVPFVVTGL